MKKQLCSICEKNYKGFGNNSKPVNNGRCCNGCNYKVVIPARIEEMEKIKLVDIPTDKDRELLEDVKGQENEIDNGQDNN